MRQSIWLSSKEPFSAPSLQQDLTCDICIVGGGICGVYSAYVLAKQGFSVVLVEALSDVAHGTTAYSTGKLTVQHELIYSKLPLEDARRYYQANQQAIEQVVALKPPSLMEVTSYIYSATDQGKEQLLKEAQRYDELGIPYTATNEIELTLPITLALGIKNEAQMNPLEFTQHFAQLARQHGAQLFTNTRITTVNVKERTLQTEQQHRITYQKLILCTHYPIESMRNLNVLKLQISRSYLSATKCLDTLQGQYLSIDNPGRTIRTALINEEPYFLYGGFSHSPATARQSDYYEALQQEVQSLFDLPVPEYIWDAQDMTTFDQVPYIGQVTTGDDSLYVATGFNKWGLSSSLVAANLLCDLLKNVPNDAASVFSPGRSNFGKTLYFMLQTGGYVAKEFIKGYMTKMGAPRCTHLGCKTKWNETENTWDCPCHGSRYNAKGEVIEGPAVYPLNIKKSGTS